ncbi:hypothetical protein GQ53DRAFT_854224 [Thozetella sp. PMI_491]|nr:hypothetical protein GQ53DRAFT_854224 [Thozetella sp. PMI_491]
MTSVEIPDSQITVKVSIIDTGARMMGPLSFFIEPPLLQHLEHRDLGAPAYVFLVEHGERRLLFDLGIKRNPFEYPPVVKEYHSAFRIKGGEEVFDLLRHGGVDLNTAEAIIWSHHHLDHTGNPTGFPSTTDLIVGPGFKKTIHPGFPAHQDGMVLESDYEGRTLREISFDQESNVLDIGGFRAVDYFGDGSFYLLETPGHSIDHLCGLARTSLSPSRFILMGADLGHHASQWRPTEFLPLPKELELSPLGTHSKFNIRTNVCPGEVFTKRVHPRQSDMEPFACIKSGHPYDVDMARNALKTMEPFDADENIMLIMAHDFTLLPVLEFWPKSANEWYRGHWKELGHWKFLEDFAVLLEDRK